MSGVKVKIAGIDTASLPIVSHEHMMETFRRMHQGEEQAKEDLVMCNLRLVFVSFSDSVGAGSHQKTFFK